MDGAALADELERIFARTRADGTYHYTTRDARDGLVSLMLVGSLDVAALPASLSSLLERFLSDLGLGASASGADVSRAVSAYFAKNPLNAELAKELARFARGASLGEGAVDEAQASKAAKLLGAASGPRTAPRAEDQGKGLQAMLALRTGASAPTKDKPKKR